MGRYFPFTEVCWLSHTDARVRLCLANTEACHISRWRGGKGCMCHVCVCSSYWQVQAMNEVSALSPFSARYTSINFTTSQSGELGTETMIKMRWNRRTCFDDDYVCVNTVCVCVCLGILPLFPSFSLSSLSLSAPSFLPLLSGQEVARGYNILSDPIIVTVEEERDKWEMGRQKDRQKETDERGEERRMGHCAGHNAAYNFPRNWSRCIRKSLCMCSVGVYRLNERNAGKFPLVGAAVTVAVTWSCSVLHKTSRSTFMLTEGG